MLEFLIAALPTMIATVTLGLLSWVTKHVIDFMRTFKEQHEILMESQRNQLKDRIVEIYETASARGYITPMGLDALNRDYDSYSSLNGNTYVGAIVEKANRQLPCIGEPIPEH